MTNITQLLKKTVASSSKRACYSFLIAVFTVLPLANLIPQPASALSGSSFNPGYIISDSTFYNSASMNQFDIQSWLNAQVPTCDTNGTQASTHSNGSGGVYSRAQWGAINGNPAPYTCLKDYRLTTDAVAANAYCSFINGGNRSAAELITAVSRACGINPQVLLVLLQKEQGLVTDDWPWPGEYAAATGYGCPDTAGCATQYGGLFNQLYWASWQYQSYRANPTQFNFRAGRTQNIPYNPNSACGSSPVYIQNQATAGLYDYTPYQPNAAALNNLNGTGDGCSAYGNRNFWRTFNNWFGDPTAGCQSTGSSQVVRLYDPRTYQHYYTTDTCEANMLVQRYGYSLEGTVFNTMPGTTPGAAALWRMYNSRTGIHFYATNQADIAGAGAAGYTLEGVAFYVASAGVPGAFPVYRMYNPRTFIHLWVTSQADINGAAAGGYQLEGVNFYATP